MESSGPIIPIRASSKNALYERKKDLEAKHNELAETIAKEDKEIKLKGSFDLTWWMSVGENEAKKAELHTLKRKVSMLESNFDDQDEAAVRKYRETPQGRRQIEDEEAVKQTANLIKQHQAKLAPGMVKTKRNIFVEMFMGSKSGWDFDTTHGPRDQDLGTQFKNELRKEMLRPMNARNPAHHWCPVAREYCNNENKNGMVCGHLFPSKCGQEAMSAIHGEAELDMYIGRPGPKGELYRAVNGIYWSAGAELRFSNGLFVIVPDLNIDATPAELATWEASSPKKYRLRVTDPEHKDMLADINPSSSSPRPWNSIDGQRLLFNDPEKLKRKAEDPSFEYEVVNFRPRARYLYWAYIEAMLRKVYKVDKSKYPVLRNQKAMELGKQEVGKPYWGSRGKYIKKHYIQGFIEVMGHEYEHLIDGAIEPENGEEEDPDPTVVAVANHSIVKKNKAVERQESDWNSDDEEEE